MSRETDSSSSGPQGRGGSSYPPGTEPYGPGSPAGESADAAQGAGTSGGSGERKTETTLTTRIRINIPGSRPIPPVVMRKPVTGGGASEGGAAGVQGPGESADAAVDPGASVPLGGFTPGPRTPGDTGPGRDPGGAGPAGAGAGGDAAEAGAGGGDFTQETSSWFAPRKPKAASPPPQSASGDRAPGDGGAYGSGSPYDTGATPLGHPDTPPDGFPAMGDAYGAGGPYGAGDPYGRPGGPGAEDTGEQPPHPLEGLLDGLQTRAPSAGASGGPLGAGDEPAGPTTGPATGDMRVPPADPGAGLGASPGTGPLAGPGADPLADPLAGPGADPFAGLTGTGAPGGGDAPASSTLGLGTGPAPFAPGGVGESMLAKGGRPGEPGDAGDLGAPPGDPGSPSGDPGAPSGDPGGRVASDTLVSGIPRVPTSRGGAPVDPQDDAGDEPGTSAPDGGRTGADRAGQGAPSGGGRSKLVLAGAGLVGVLAVAYGAGLLLDHADVPNGTTVLGVDIGGKTRHDAVNKLEAALGDSTTKPFTVVAGGKKTTLKPSVAGLTLDTEATVGNAAGRDYNPVSVIGSLFGGTREAEPAIKVDKEKMASALTHVSRETGDGGAPQDGAIKFVSGHAVAVPGKPHKGIDEDAAAKALQKAYRTRAATGSNKPVELPVSMQQPKVGKKEIARAMKEFAEPAMSGLVTIKAGDAEIKFSPQKSLPKFLAMKPVNGRLVDTYDLQVLQQLYGTTFDGVRITRGNGSKTPVMPQDVAGALRTALKQTDPAKRVQRIPLNPQ